MRKPVSDAVFLRILNRALKSIERDCVFCEEVKWTQLPLYTRPLLITAWRDARLHVTSVYGLGE